MRGRASAMVAILSGSQWLGLDTATGRPIAGPIDLGFVPVRPVQDADLDGDGTPEILALGPGPATGQQVLSAFSTGTGFKPWAVTVNAKYEKIDDVFLIHDLPDEIRSPPNWPLVADLDGDGRSEVFVPDAGPMPPGTATAACGPSTGPPAGRDGCGRCARGPRPMTAGKSFSTPPTWTATAPRPGGRIAVRRPRRAPRRPVRALGALGESTSMRSRARTAVRSGSGAWTCRSSRSPASRRPMVGPRAGWLAAPGRHDRQSSPLGIPDVPDPAADRPQPGSLDRPRGACGWRA